MNFYTLLNISSKIKNATLKLLGVYILHLLGRRHLSVRIDPSLNCNLFCKMCYFSSMEQRKKLKGIIPETEFKHIAEVLFPKALQVYIGCGAEPTTHRNFFELIDLAKTHNVPDIGVVTNGQLLTDKQIEKMVDLKLNELTLSCHGTKKETYEFFMVNAKHDRFIEMLEKVQHYKTQKKSRFPEIRINYTVNNKNLTELADFFDIFDRFNISTLQVRPVLDIGGEYSHAITKDQMKEYNDIITKLKAECAQKGIRLLANTSNLEFKKKNSNEKVAQAVYCYIDPKTSEQFKFDWSEITFREFSKKTEWKKKTSALLFNKKRSTLNKSVANYDVIE